jgi:hypothetical protein
VSIPPIEGTLAAKPFTNAMSGGLSGSLLGAASGTLSGSSPLKGSIAGDSSESPENSAVAELGGLISSLGSLSAQAQSLPLSVPTLPGSQQPPSYQPQATDYLQFAEDQN